MEPPINGRSAFAGADEANRRMAGAVTLSAPAMRTYLRQAPHGDVWQAQSDHQMLAEVDTASGLSELPRAIHRRSKSGRRPQLIRAENTIDGLATAHAQTNLSANRSLDGRPSSVERGNRCRDQDLFVIHGLQRPVQGKNERALERVNVASGLQYRVRNFPIVGVDRSHDFTLVLIHAERVEFEQIADATD